MPLCQDHNVFLVYLWITKTLFSIVVALGVAFHTRSEVLKNKPPYLARSHSDKCGSCPQKLQCYMT